MRQDDYGQSTYYETVLLGFYRIRLPDEIADLVNQSFFGASSHLKLSEIAKLEGNREYFIKHITRFRSHVRFIMRLVRRYGDFTNSEDATNRGLDCKEFWDPSVSFCPGKEDFTSMSLDYRHKLGQDSDIDCILFETEPMSSDSIDREWRRTA